MLFSSFLLYNKLPPLFIETSLQFWWDPPSLKGHVEKPWPKRHCLPTSGQVDKGKESKLGQSLLGTIVRMIAKEAFSFH